MRFVPVRPRKPVLGNLALAGALVLVNGFRAACFLVFWALNR
jgi:hypothetical protein